MEVQTEAKPVVFVTQPEVAEMLHHTTTATLRWWRHQNRGPRSIRLGKRVLYRLSDVEEWLSAQEAETARGGVQ
jgi:predicted DNA-binding transcriptional regulator AlpA